MLAVILVLVLAACASPARDSATPDPSADFTSAQIRHPAVVLRIVLGDGEFAAHERTLLPGAYEGTLREALSARDRPPLDIHHVSQLDRPAAALRAREVGADHALLIDVRIDKVETYFYREGPPSAPGTGHDVGSQRWCAPGTASLA